MSLLFIDLYTDRSGGRDYNDGDKVSIMYSTKTKEFRTIGIIPHNSLLRIDQALIDKLQQVLDQKENQDER